MAKSSVARVTLTSLMLVVATSGCDQLEELLGGSNQALCDQSVATVRQALGFEQFESAKEWRDYAWKACKERAVIATIDKEIESAIEAYNEAQKKKKAMGVEAKERVNAAQALWLEYDALASKKRDKEALDRARTSAERLAKGLDAEYAKLLRAYNRKEYQKRLAKLAR